MANNDNEPQGTMHVSFSPRTPGGIGMINTALGPGQYVELHGLVNSSHLNGQSGIIDGELKENGRYTVQLHYPWKDPKTGESKDHPLSLKPENLKHVADTPDLGESMSCSGCKAAFPASKLLVCSQCKLVRYCNQDCQRKHWKAEHRDECNLLQTARQGPSASRRVQDPGDRVYGRMMAGLRHMQKGKLTIAERFFRLIVEEDKCYMIGHYNNLASTQLQLGKVDEALANFRKAVVCEPCAPEDKFLILEAYRQMSYALEAKGDIPGAKNALREVLSRDPGNVEAKMMLEKL